MGADIHCYIEYAQKSFKGDTVWFNFGSSINPGRDYMMFGVLAGVRTENPNIAPRGLPQDIAWRTADDAYLTISDAYPEEQGYCSSEQAAAYNRNGHAYVTNDKGENIRVEHPDWHSHSWLTTDEFMSAIKTYKDRASPGRDLDPEYYAIHAAMQELEKRSAGVRLVFWFDN